MIDEIRQAIVNELKSLYPEAKRYLDNVPQGFARPSFRIAVIEQGYKKRLTGAYRSTISLDVAYFSAAGQAGILSDCLRVQETLLRGFDLVEGFRITSKDARVTDQVLHLTFDVKYSERQVEPGTLMGTVTTNFVSKE
ncbi:hypothetical protein SDC9_151794 [bioreactor metagenome]|uniref:DUF3168 domain-containing protein n=1 Tax=bioreactor metagenome TaxID=1076179 RepID=A0A645EVM0_9ZZZZ